MTLLLPVVSPALLPLRAATTWPINTYTRTTTNPDSHLGDGALEVVEPHEPNSGLPQGCLLRRHAVPRAAAGLPGGGAVGWRDVVVGCALRLYGRSYEIAGCDAATRAWLAARGAAPAADAGWPEGPRDAGARERARRDQERRPASPLAPRRPPPPFAFPGGGGGGKLGEGSSANSGGSRSNGDSGRVLRFFGAYDGGTHASSAVRRVGVGERRPDQSACCPL